MSAVMRRPEARASFDLRDDLVHLRPIGGTSRLEVINLRGDARLPGDPDQFIDRLVQGVTLVPHMRDVDPAVLGNDAAQFDELLGGRVERRRVDQATTQARARRPPWPAAREPSCGSSLPVLGARSA